MMATAENGSRIWYQSFTDPAVDAPYFDRLTRRVQGLAGPGFSIDVHGMQPGDRHLHRLSEMRCSVQAVRNAVAAQEQGYEAFVVGHFQEPGLFEARAAVDIPVIGLGEATMLHACSLGRKIALVTISPVFVAFHEEQIARHGLQHRVVAVRAVESQVADYNRAFTDPETYQRLKQDFSRQSAPLLELGVDVVIPAGGYPMLLFARERSFTIGGAMVLDGLPVTVLAAEVAARLKHLNGTGTSRTPGFALPSAAALQEFVQSP
ncbi:aspartate/glutamate racemase family protein [Streptomyces sp. NPDC127084]|uniref:aspartate/glutamate racemase family protein n=1 Tax=Streptomyces sp. NPDC127084 TaxID=3347133 RepID=UPI0036589ED9